MQTKEDEPEAPTRLVYLTDLLEDVDGTQEEKFRGFVRILEDSLGLQAEEASLAKTWAKSIPQEAQGAGLSDYMSSVYLPWQT